MRTKQFVNRSITLVACWIVTGCLAFAQPPPTIVACDGCDAPSAVKRDAPQIASAAPPQANGHASSSSATAANQNSGLSLGDWLRRAGNDQWRIYSGPFRSESAIKWDILVAAGTGGLIAADRHITNQLPRDHLKLSRDISNIGSYATIGSVGAIWLAGMATDNAHARETGILGIESVANSAAVWAVMNTLTRRERPLEGTGQGRFWVNNGLKSSMPSAHSMLTWAAATTIAHEYPHPAIEALAYGAATAVSVTRVTGLRHFPADSFLGSVVGFLIAREMFQLHCTPGLSTGCHNAHGGKRDLLLDEDTSTAQANSSEPRRTRIAHFLRKL